MKLENSLVLRLLFGHNAERLAETSDNNMGSGCFWGFGL